MGTEKQAELRIWGTVLGIGLVLIILGTVLGPTLLADTVAVLESGVGLKTAALWSFLVTLVMFLLFAIVAGDGLLGEIQFMLAGFFLFFLIITLLIAWIF
jgi:hypothetical protein